MTKLHALLIACVLASASSMGMGGGGGMGGMGECSLPKTRVSSCGQHAVLSILGTEP